jgi:hypothetical protein
MLFNDVGLVNIGNKIYIEFDGLRTIVNKTIELTRAQNKSSGGSDNDRDFKLFEQSCKHILRIAEEYEQSVKTKMEIKQMTGLTNGT